MAQAPNAPQQDQVQALASPPQVQPLQDAGQPAGQPAAQEPEVFIFFILFLFLFCGRFLPRGFYLLSLLCNVRLFMLTLALLVCET